MSARLRLSVSLIGLCLLPAAAIADGRLIIPGLSPEVPQPRPSYRQAYNDFPPGHYGGGFVEFVMSGGQRSLLPRNDLAPGYATPILPAPTQVYAAPVYAAPVYGAPVVSGPVYAPSPLHAALPPGGLPAYSPQQPPAYYGLAASRQEARPFAQPVAYGAPGNTYDPIATDPGLATRPINPIYNRQMVAYAGEARPGTILVDTTNKFLYLVQPRGQAIRYGIGVGRPGFVWSGTKTITRKAEWPDWTPPKEMMARRPDLPRHMDGGEANPLGARALYLGTSEYRIHGTNEPYTIGTNVSSGCIRMMNQDVIDLYGRVGVGTRVVVM